MAFLDILGGKAPAPAPAAPAPAGDPLDAAMASAGIDAAPAPGAPAPAPADPRGDLGAALEQKPTGDALIAFVESWVPLLVRGYAVANGREWNREMDAACRLSITEKANLRLTADAAAPYVARLIAHSEKLAALGFVVQLGFVLVGKFQLVKQQPRIVKTTAAERTAPDETEGAQATAPAERPRPAPVHRRPVGRPRK